MPEFEDYAAEARQIEQEIIRKGLILGIDWNNTGAVRGLAKQALARHDETLPLGVSLSSPEGMAKMELFGLAQLMLKVMKDSADDNRFTHGGPVWKSFAEALWAEYQSRQ
jgi:hypothetical protein